MSRSNERLSRRRASISSLRAYAAVVWLILLAILISLSLEKLSQGYTFDSNILTLLPNERLPRQLLKVNKEIIKERDRDLILLVRSDFQNEDLSKLTSLYHQLKSSDLFENVVGPQNSIELEAINNIYAPLRFNVLSQDHIERLEKNDQTLIDDATKALFSPAGLSNTSILEDPLGLFQHWQIDLQKNQPLFFKDNWLTAEENGQRYRFLHLRLKQSSFNPEYQRRVTGLLENASEALGNTSELLTSGMIIHAAHGTLQAKQEIATIGIGSLTGIILLLMFVFRSLRELILVLLPLTVGITVSFCLCLMFFEKIHLITLAFGTSLIGIAIDYSLHYLCARMEDGEQALAKLLPGLTLAMISSVSAYVAQAIAPFPGLRQMATFTALGLIAAWVSVVLLLPFLSNHRLQHQRAFTDSAAHAIRSWATSWARSTQGSRRALLWLLALIAIIGASQIRIDDSLKALQTSSQLLIENDLRVSKLMNSDSVGNYFLVQGANEQQVLEREEILRSFLHQLENDNRLAGHRSTSQHLPSVKQQYRNYQLLQTYVYAEDGLAQQLFNRIDVASLFNEVQTTFNSTPFSAVTWKQWQQHPNVDNFNALWIGKIDDQHFSMVSLIAPQLSQIGDDLKYFANTIEGVNYIDRPESITHILTEYRKSLFKLLVLAYGLITLLLCFRYGRQALSVIAPAFFASVSVLFFMFLNSMPLTVFHCLALLLVLGIGLDAAILLRETAASAYTWLAISTSSVTTFLAFGLLSLSQTPVLQFFGQTVAIGIFSIWLLAPLLCIPKDQLNA